MPLKEGGLKNHSQLREERMDAAERALHKNRCKWLDGTFSTVGHTYSVMVEILKIKEPNVNAFVEEINKLLEYSGNGFARIKDPTQYFYHRTFHYLLRYLYAMIRERKISEVNAKCVLSAAYEGWRPPREI